MTHTYIYLHAQCINCDRFISVNPNHCPSIRIKDGRPDPQGQREPLCRACFEKWNEINRTSKGLEPKRLHPEAYEPGHCGSRLITGGE